MELLGEAADGHSSTREPVAIAQTFSRDPSMQSTAARGLPKVSIAVLRLATLSTCSVRCHDFEPRPHRKVHSRRQGETYGHRERTRR